MEHKILPINEAVRSALDLQSIGKRMGFTIGFFDIIQAAHVEFLEKARSAGDALLVGVCSDAFTTSLLGTQFPVYPCKDRMKILGTLEMTDLIVELKESPREILQGAFKPDVYVPCWDFALYTERYGKLPEDISIAHVEITHPPRDVVTEVRKSY